MNTPAPSPRTDSLPSPVKHFIVFMAMLQGLLLYLAKTGQEQQWWPFNELHGCVYWYTLVLSVPSVLMLSVRDLAERRFWLQGVGVTLVFIAVSLWAAWSATGGLGIEAGKVLWPFGLSMAAALFVALPYLQAALRYGRWNARYPDLFEFAWQNALTLILTTVFTGICWLVLALWGELFMLIGIEFFKELFSDDAFIYLATGLMVGLGILIGRTQHKPVQVARRILFAIFTGLLPLIALIAVLFVISLPFTGLQPLWETRSAASILMSLVAVMVLFTNAVYQDGDEAMPYPMWLRRLVDAGLLVLPVFAALALYAMALRIGQYGWTQDRLAGVIVALILAVHAFGYAWAVLRSRRGWLAGLKPVNVVVSLAAMLVAVLVNSPLIDPHRISAASQIARLQDGRIDANHFDVDHLRFDSGRQGYRALRGLAESDAASASPRVAERIEQALQRQQRRQWRSTEQLRSSAIRDVAQLQARIALAPGSAQPQAAWWVQITKPGFEQPECLQADADCVLIVRDFDQDGRADHLLCNLGGERWGRNCQLYAGEHDGWRRVGRFGFGESESARVRFEQALREGRIELQEPRWPVIEGDGIRRALDEPRCIGGKDCAGPEVRP
ncbi:MAG: DUF4153 domain-containing protein [Pseudomonadota bacterium]|nr:DUF4153 domain-containing protein [Pseudomonadota bacterium]